MKTAGLSQQMNDHAPSRIWIGLLAGVAALIVFAALKGDPVQTLLHIGLRHSHALLQQEAAAPVPAKIPCQMLPPDNILRTPVDTLPIDPQSDLLIQDANVNASLHADFGKEAIYGIPYNVADASTPSKDVKFEDTDESDRGPYLIGPVIEGAEDHHLITISPSCKLYEMYAAKANPDGTFSAFAGAIFDLSSNKLRPDKMTTADAAGLPILPLMVTYDEIASGQINHVLRFTTNRTQAAHVWPARHDSGLGYNPASPFLPMGAVIRLKADVDISGFSPTNRIILTAMKKYGMMLADNGGQLFFTGTPDPRWNDDDLAKLRQIKFKDFEVVSRKARAAQMIHPDSGQAKQ